MNKDLILREQLALQRTIMANQTTLLAFIRTSMYFLVAGISLHNLLDIRYGFSLQLIFMVIAAVLLLVGVVNFKIHQRRIRNSERHIGNFQDDYLTKD